MEWELVDAALEVIGIFQIRKYVWRRQTTIVECVAGRMIYDICTNSERMYISSRFLRWWDQEYGTT